MKRNLAVVLTAVVAVAAMLLAPSTANSAPAPAAFTHNVCGPPSQGSARCHAKVVDLDAGGPGKPPTPDATTSPTGLTPAQIKSAYGFSTVDTAGAGETIAIVDAYDDPTAESDLNVFSGQFGLPACTTANGCFKKVDQTGGTSYPASNAGWALEISLDIQWAHAVAPGAKILLVEATTNSYANLFAAVDYAASQADYISMSWGSSEFSGETSYDGHFTVPNKSYFVSAGDNGTPAEYPSSSPNVLSIGGTKLTFSGGTLTSETGWTDGGGGCSVYETKKAAQAYPAGLCATNKRATPDISLDADPASGVSVYDTTPYNGATGWFVVGGTSASAPMVAARASQTGTLVDAAYVYGSNVKVRDITVGNNGAACAVGFDLCTGRGTWVDSDSLATTSTTAPPKATTASVTSIAYANGSNRSLLITVTVKDDLGHLVSGAAVGISVNRGATGYASGNGTTGSSGTVTFRLNRAPSGSYSTTVTSLSAAGLTWDGKTPLNSFNH